MKNPCVIFIATKKSLFVLLLVTALMIAGVNIVRAQALSSMSGRIADSSGATVPGVVIIVTSLETGVARSVTADEVGAYRVLDLPVGQYQVRAEKAGFKAAIQTGIDLAVGQQAVVNLRLEVGSASEQITVTADAPLVNTTTSSVSGLVGEREVKDLPLNGRSFDQLILLNAGTVSYSGMRNGGGGGNGVRNMFSVAGRRAFENYFTLNGVELAAANLDVSVPFGASGDLLGVEAVREFNVQTDSYGAEYGKRPGGQVTLVTSSGSNQFHGSLYEFLRNSKLDARNFFDRLVVPPFKRNQFGGSAGGPIKKDKTFIFGNYEGFRQRLGLSAAAIVPDNLARQGQLPNASTGVYAPVAGLQAGMLPYFAYWPVANGPEVLVSGLPTGLAQYFANPAQAIREDFGTVRLDHMFSTKDSLNGSYTVDDGYSTSPLTTNPVFIDTLSLRAHTVSLQETHIFSPGTINVFTAGVARTTYLAFTPPISSFPSSLAFVAGTLPGNISIGGGASGGGVAGSVSPGGPGSPTIATDAKTVFSYQDQLQLIKGKHTIMIGGLLQRQRDNQTGAANMLGRATFANLQAFLQGTVQNFQVIPNTTARTWRQYLGTWYVQDGIQLTRRLSLRVGLRHEFTNGWNDPTGRASNYVYDANGVIVTDPIIGTSPLTENNSILLFGPRVGLAWDPFGDGKTSIRAGFGTYYFVQDNLTSVTKQVQPFNGAVVFLNANFLSQVPVNPSVPVPPACHNGPPTVPGTCSVFASNGLEPYYKTPTIEEWNFSIERQITSNMALRVAYVGSEGYHQFVAVEADAIPAQICSNPAGCVSGGVNGFSVVNGVANPNLAGRGLAPQGAPYIPVQPFRPNPNIANGFNWRAEGVSNYNALQVEVKERYSHGLSFRANYTWSKSLNTASGNGAGNAGNNDPQNVLDPNNMRSSWGPDGHDYRHQASISGGYELPFGQGKAWLAGVAGVGGKLVSGWQINGIVSALSGFPITPLAGSNVTGNGDLANPDRVSWNPAFTGDVVTGDPNQWFNPRAFISPQSGTFGNVGRGVLRGPGFFDLDTSVFKTTTLTERLKLQFRAEFFNVLNHTNFANVNNTVFSGGQLTTNPTINPSAGRILGTIGTSRQIQFGLKLMF